MIWKITTVMLSLIIVLLLVRDSREQRFTRLSDTLVLDTQTGRVCFWSECSKDQKQPAAQPAQKFDFGAGQEQSAH